MNKNILFSLLLVGFCTFLSLFLFAHGHLSIPISETFFTLLNPSIETEFSQVILDYRLPKIIAAFLGGGCLAISGLIMQTYFQNPLAGPFVLGVQSGSSLGVAFLIMGEYVFAVNVGSIGIIGSSFIGAIVTLFILLLISKKVPGKITLIIFGLIFSHLVSALVNIMVAMSPAREIKAYLVWGLGSFSRTSGPDLMIFSIICFVGVSGSLLISKNLNLLLLGKRYAVSMGLDVDKLRIQILALTAILSSVVTAFCGPIAFVGVIAPHLVKWFSGLSNHYFLIPLSFLMGGAFTLIAESLSNLGVSFILPINSVLGLLGGPIIMLLLLKNIKRGQVNE